MSSRVCRETGVAISCIHGCLLIVDTQTLVDSTGFEERRRVAALRYYLLKKHPLINEIAINLRQGYGRQASRATALLRNDNKTDNGASVPDLGGIYNLITLLTLLHNLTLSS